MPGQTRSREFKRLIVCFTKEPDPRGGRAATLRRLLDEESAEGRNVWAAFDWVEDISLDAALRQQRELREVAHERPATLATGVVERVMDDWSLAEQRRARRAPRAPRPDQPLRHPRLPRPLPPPPPRLTRGTPPCRLLHQRVGTA